MSSSIVRWRRYDLVRCCQLLICIALLFFATQLSAAEHFVSASVARVDCASVGIRPGDAITLAAGNRGPLTIRNCSGTLEKPITVRNDTRGSGPTVIRRTVAATGGFVFICSNCVHVVIDGTGSWEGAPQGAYCGAPAGRNGCGIKVTSVAANDSPSAYLKMTGKSTKVAVRGVEIDGRRSDLKTLGIGIDQNDHSITVADNPNFWREDSVYEKNYVHDVDGEGMYIGPNWREPDLRVPLRNITIRNNLVEHTGREGIQMKSAIEGTNKIHNNVVRRSGLRNEGARQGAGISVTEGGHVKIYSNWVEAAGVQGIQHYNGNIPSDFGPFGSEIYNNVVYDSGKLGGTLSNGIGITVGPAEGSAPIIPIVYNNTVVKTAQAGINFGSRVTGGVARDNIVTEWGSQALTIGNNKSVNNLADSITTIRFIDAGRLSFELMDNSPAREAGSIEGFPRDDFKGAPRPQGVRADQGAFEFSLATSAPPAAPKISIE